MVVSSPQQFTLGRIGKQQLLVNNEGGTIVSDAGLLAVRALEKPLGVIAGLARRLPDPRSPKYRSHSTEAILTQEVYQILAGYPDFNDARDLRHDALFQILAEVAPDPDRPLASASTLARFSYAYTRRDAQRPPEERPVLAEVQAARCQRLQITNDYLVALFIRTRRTPPAEIILDVDATADPVHGRQTLSAYHGYFRQHQYFPVLVFEGHSGFPLAGWLRPGTAHASWGVTDILASIVAGLRRAWPDVRLMLRGDSGLAVPEVYAFCEAHGLEYTLGYAGNAALQRAVAGAVAEVELYWGLYGWRQQDPHVQRFEEIRDYQAARWPHPRRVIAKIERTPQGAQQRFVVTNRPEASAVIYRDVYVPRGAVPEQPIEELKNGLRADRLSACGFRANAFRLLVHLLAYAIVVLFREASAGLAEVARATVSTLRQQLWKVGAVVVCSARRVWLRFSSAWPHWSLWVRVCEAVTAYVARLARSEPAAGLPVR
jgi:Transposase DDE domain group 1